MYFRVNGLLCNFKYCSFESLRMLFQSYCTSFYGCPLWKLSDTDTLSVCWRKCVRRLLKLNFRTHSFFIPLILQKPDLQTQLLMCSVSFMHNCFKSSNVIVKMCADMSLTSTSSTNSNVFLITSRLRCSTFNVENGSARALLYDGWEENVCENQLREAAMLLELIGMHDALTSHLNFQEICHIIDSICTN